MGQDWIKMAVAKEVRRESIVDSMKRRKTFVIILDKAYSNKTTKIK